MTARTTRVQFRLDAYAHFELMKRASESGLPLSLVARDLLNHVLLAPDISENQQHEDLLVCRAGIERLFERSDRSDELQDAVTRLRGERAAISKPKHGRTSS